VKLLFGLMAQRPSHGCVTAKTAFEELLAEVFALDEQHAASNSSRRVARRLQPLIGFVERYAVAVDVAVQGCPSPAILVWGALRGLLIVSIRRTQEFWRHSYTIHCIDCRLSQPIF
jgi:hypothetical protein